MTRSGDPRRLGSKGAKVLYEEVTTYGEGGSADVAEEIRQLEELLEQNPDNLDITEWLAFKLYQDSRYPRAVQLYRRLIEAGHRPGVQNFYLGNTFYKMGDNVRATECWEKVLELIPSDPKAEKARARIGRISGADP